MRHQHCKSILKFGSSPYRVWGDKTDKMAAGRKKSNQISSGGLRPYLCPSLCWSFRIDAVTTSPINNSDSLFPEGACVSMCDYVNTYVNTTGGDKEKH